MRKYQFVILILVLSHLNCSSDPNQEQKRPVSPPETTLILKPSENNPRNSEGDFVELKDGRLMCVYSRFYGDSRSDFGSSSLARSEEHTSELQSRENLVCRLLLDKNKQNG